ncbi:MAG TPA: CocE/NonD family hydrolase [Acidimicrobiales bacterium]|nr:CocE/NonD family hydrolase [Acidimicrobiales bacterium]
MTTDVGREQVQIPVDGGDTLAGDVVLPAGGPAPAVVSLYPYHKDDVIGSLFEGPRRRLACDGYAALLVDMRGHGGSTGSSAASFDLAGREGSDAAEVVEWAAAQPWCDGNVGIWGVSYGGMNALAAAARRPPHLKAAVSVYAGSDPGHDVIAPGRVPMAFNRYLWSAHMLAMDLCPPSRRDREGSWRRVWDERLARMRERPGYAFDWQARRDDEHHWRAKALDVSRIDVPTLVIGGWHDFFIGATVRDIAAMSAPCRSMVIGPWLHVLPDLAEEEPFDWVGEMTRWWRTHLGGGRRPRQPSARAVVFVSGARRWRRYDSLWPPPSARQVALHAMAGNRLSPFPPAGVHEISYVPRQVTGRCAGFFDPLGTGLGMPEDQHGDDLESLSFDSEALVEPLQLAGIPRVSLVLASPPERELRLVCKLSDVSPEGHSTLLASGHKQVPAGDSAPVELECTPTAAVLELGHRLRMALSSADFPRFWPSGELASLVLALGAGAGCTVVLPVVAGEDGGEDCTDELVRPQRGAAAGEGWVRSGSVSRRVSVVEPGRRFEVELEVASELAPPSGSVMRFDERFGASVSLEDPASACVAGDVRITLEDGPEWRVEVRVSSSYGERRAEAEATVGVNGATVFEERWALTSAPGGSNRQGAGGGTTT